MPRTLLIVDDDPLVTKAFIGLLTEEGYHVFAAHSAKEALHTLAEQPAIEVVIADHHMPKTTGSELFAQIKKSHPNIIRIMLSGYVDPQTMLGAINDGEIFKFLTKPWNSADVRQQVQHAFEQYDLTVRQGQQAAVIEFRNMHDPITGLANRVLFTDHLLECLKESKENNQNGAVLFIDLDRYRNIIDNLGRTIGDQLLNAVAQRLKPYLLPTYILARFDIDEFVVLVPNFSNLEEIEQLAEKVMAIFEDAFVVQGYEIFSTPSIGIAVFPQDGKDSDAIICNATAAMYKAKKGGRNCYQFYSSSMNAHALRQVTLEQSLHHALKEQQFLLYYQPERDAQSRKIAGAQVVMRWLHPEHGLILPDDFLPLAEQSGIIISLGEWLIRNACLQAVQWQQPNKKITYSINVSMPLLIQKNFVNLIKSILQETKCPPDILEIEINESSILASKEEVAQRLQELRFLGVKIALNDFGTGYAPLAYLKMLPIQTLKIAYEFVHNITTNANNAAIVAGIINIAKELGLRSCADGVENKEQWELLRDLGCDAILGHLGGDPASVAKFSQLLRGS